MSFDCCETTKEKQCKVATSKKACPASGKYKALCLCYITSIKHILKVIVPIYQNWPTWIAIANQNHLKKLFLCTIYYHAFYQYCSICHGFFTLLLHLSIGFYLNDFFVLPTHWDRTWPYGIAINFLCLHTGDTACMTAMCAQ